MKVEKVALELITVKDRYRKDLGSLDALKDSIETVGLLHPIIVTSSWRLVCGQRRMEAAKLLGWQEIPAHIVDIDALIVAERDENETVKPFTVSERTALGKAIEETIRKQNGERRGRPATKGSDNDDKDVQHGKNGHIGKTSKNKRKNVEDEIVENLPQLNDGEKTRQAAAKGAGFGSEKSYRDAKKLADLGSKDLRDAVDDNLIKVSDAAAICDQTHDIQDEAVRRVLHGEANTAKVAVQIILAERTEQSIELPPEKDCNGIFITDNVRYAYDATPLFEEIRKKTEEVRFLLNKLDKKEIRANVQKGQLQSYCKTIETAMEVERFGFMCPACEGDDGANCNCCSNVRWFQERDKSAVDLKKWRKGKWGQ